MFEILQQPSGWDPYITPVAMILVGAISAGAALLTTRRTANAQDRQTDIDHDDKILAHYDGLVTTLDARATSLEEKLKDMEERFEALSAELSLVKILFDDAIRFIRKVRNWDHDRALFEEQRPMPDIPSSLEHLIEPKTPTEKKD